MTNWHERWLQTAALQATFSKDRSTQVGAVIVSPDNIQVSQGWNGFPRGCPDDRPQLHERPEKYVWTIHAEINAILNAARIGRSVADCTLYCTHFPCSRCATLIAQAGIKQVVVPVSCSDDFKERWADEVSKAKLIFDTLGVAYGLQGDFAAASD